MTAQANAREALLIEALGEMATVVDRVESLVPLLQETRQSLIDAKVQLSKQLRAAEGHMVALTEHAKKVAVTHIAQRTDEIARHSQQRQLVEMHDLAHKALDAEIRPTLEQLIAPLNRLARQAEQRERTWADRKQWLTYLTIASGSSVVGSLTTTVLWWL